MHRLHWITDGVERLFIPINSQRYHLTLGDHHTPPVESITGVLMTDIIALRDGDIVM
jgi:hypothetical protein